MKKAGDVVPPDESVPDRDLVARFLAGDETTICLVRAWARSQLRRQLPGQSIEDLEQEVLLDLLEALEAGRFRGDSRLETYVRTFSRFKCIDRLRTTARRTFVAIEDVEVRDIDPSPFDRLARKQRAVIAERVLQQLPAGCRKLWDMVYEGLSYGEMSRRLGISEGALRVRVHRCRQQAVALRDRLLAEIGL